jgi:hypothetical protein
MSLPYPLARSALASVGVATIAACVLYSQVSQLRLESIVGSVCPGCLLVDNDTCPDIEVPCSCQSAGGGGAPANCQGQAHYAFGPWVSNSAFPNLQQDDPVKKPHKQDVSCHFYYDCINQPVIMNSWCPGQGVNCVPKNGWQCRPCAEVNQANPIVSLPDDECVDC